MGQRKRFPEASRSNISDIDLTIFNIRMRALGTARSIHSLAVKKARKRYRKRLRKTLIILLRGNIRTTKPAHFAVISQSFKLACRRNCCAVTGAISGSGAWGVLCCVLCRADCCTNCRTFVMRKGRGQPLDPRRREHLDAMLRQQCCCHPGAHAPRLDLGRQARCTCGNRPTVDGKIHPCSL
ncbi:hypothetical protein SAMN05216466_107284 [Paraburkholderia phenazinium]|uniref:Uncharacterized protein n=1 Tax=Paraburkholderia phenazinium TaxID=60549 RepID=A0A1G8A2S4_9BURK|nr:hypothetical protein SAMN05216466_107284 [Paraburkholderia phenazinium]